jgi:hypothetical protein
MHLRIFLFENYYIFLKTLRLFPVMTFPLDLLPAVSLLQFVIYVSRYITNAGDKLPSVNAE